MASKFSFRIFLSVFFLAVYGAYGIWSVRDATYGFWYTWNLRVFGACCLLSAILLFRKSPWVRYLLYVLSALTLYGWLSTALYTFFKQPRLFGTNAEQVVIGIFITLVPPMGMVGATVVAHRLFRGHENHA